jgi:hypothetical protein
VSHGLDDARGGRFLTESAGARLTGEVASVVQELCSAVAARVSTERGVAAAADAAGAMGQSCAHAAGVADGASEPSGLTGAGEDQASVSSDIKLRKRVAAVIGAHMENIAWEVHLPRSYTPEGRLDMLERHYAADVCAVLTRKFALSSADARRMLAAFVRAETERCSDAPRVSGTRSPSALRRAHARRAERAVRPPSSDRRGPK